MSAGIIALIVIVAVLVLLIIIIVSWWIRTYNKFKRYQVDIEDAKSGIDIALTKRFDLLTKMFDITKGYAKHEHDTLADVIGMRSGIPTGASVKDLSDVNAKLDKAQNAIQIVFEKYPELKANTLFLELQASSRDAEEHLQASRRLYNSNVKEYNQLLVVFPSSLIAHHYHFEKAEFFEAEEAKKKDVDMKF
jgi:LemA protein